MRRWNVFYACALAATVVAACASSHPGGTGDDGDDGDGGSEPDARSDGEPPPPVDAGPPTIIYVSIEGADSSFGTTEWPLRHVAAGVMRAQMCTPAPCSVRIAEGVYEEEVALASGVDLEGGWNRAFSSRDVLIYPVVITSDAATTMTASGLNAETIVDGITVRGADLSANVDGAASTALLVRDSGEHLRLRGTHIEGGRGARGAAGDDGTLQQCTALGGPGGQASDCSSMGGQLGDASGDPASGGAPGGGGNSNCPNACPLTGSDGVSDGTSGGNGQNGASGAPGTAVIDDDGTFSNDAWAGISGGNGGRGLHGTGGSGGGSGGTKRFRACFSCGTLLGGHGGNGAPGGCGGNGGRGGGAGGGSFGAVVIRSTVWLDGVVIAGGAGGRGGDGGDGHPGSPGGTDGTVGRGGTPQQRCGLIDYRAGAGGSGGIGGHGGAGGGGAGGAGGPSVGVALVDGTLSPAGEPGANSYELGTAGAGGAGGTGAVDAAAGPAGRVADVVHY
jgi:hypothetical protein